MLEGFLARFTALVDTLMVHPRVRVTHVWRGAPATDAEIDTLARAWGHPVPAALRTLYRQADGAQLRWVDIGDETYDAARDDRTSFDGPWYRLFEKGGAYAGYLDVPPIEALRSCDTVGAMFEDDDPQFANAVPFDSFSESADAVIFFGDGRDDPWISLGGDHLADVDPPGDRTLSHYLDHVLTTWASIGHRSRPGPPTLDGLLRQRVELDLGRIVGQRVVYRDDRRGNATMHGRVVAHTELTAPPRHWWFGPTVVEVRDDLGEPLYVPLRALFPPDDADEYERLRARPDALRELLHGPAEALFTTLSLVALDRFASYRAESGPAFSNAAWSVFALSAKLPASEAAGALIVAAHALCEHPQRYTQRTFAWPRARPYPPHRTDSCMSWLADILRDAAALHIGAAAPHDLAGWLGAIPTVRLLQLLRRIDKENPSRDHDPLTDPSTPPGFMFQALQGGPTQLDLTIRPCHDGRELGLERHRIVGAIW